MNMIKRIVSLAAVSTLALVVGCEQQSNSEAEGSQAGEVELTTLEQRFSYAIGANIGQQLANDDIELDVAAFSAAIEDLKSGEESRLSQEQIMTAMQEMQQQQQEKMQAERSAVGDTNKAEGEAFLAANAEKEGVVSLPSGLQYKVLREGEGPSPAAEDIVTVHYRGTLIDGTEFDSSYQRNEPAKFPLNSVIAGWTEGVQLMKEGAKYEFYIPSDLAYGPGGAGASIGPNSTLIFEVELLDAQQEEEAASEE